MLHRGVDVVVVTFALTIFVTLLSTASPRTFGLELRRAKRHTPFLPGDYWKDNRPDFGSTETTLNMMENSTAKFKCPISHVADSSVSFTQFDASLRNPVKNWKVLSNLVSPYGRK